MAVDPATFSDVYRRYARDIVRYIAHLSGGNQALAEDVAADTFLKIWSSPIPVEIPTVRAYLFRIARNLFLEQGRKGKRTEPLGELDLPAASESLDARGELRSVMTQLARLGELERSAMMLRVVHELSYAEVAAVLKTTEVSARVAVHRARQKLVEIRERSVAR